LSGVAFWINDSGETVGASGVCTTYNPYMLANFQPLHALLWQNGIVTDIGNLGGTGRATGNVAFSINNKGQVVGNSDLPGDQTGHAYLWQNGNMTDLGTLPGDLSSAALAINESGVVIGTSEDKDDNSRAMVIQDGVMQDLNDLVPVDSPLFLLLGCAVNSGGEIDGVAANKVTGEIHGFLAVPNGNAAAISSISPALRISATPTVLSDDVRKLFKQRLPVGRFGGFMKQQ
jgi:probable HAF family extracellular repeat protein